MSLPPRERELKHGIGQARHARAVSLPPRERELKLEDPCLPCLPDLSLPPRERELKRKEDDEWRRQGLVAPPAGA